MSVYSEWQESEEGDNHATCQDCHIGPRGNVRAYHGFDEVARNVYIYRDDLSIEDIKFDFPEFSFTIRNLVSGHAIPASGPPKVMAWRFLFEINKEQKSTIYIRRSARSSSSCQSGALCRIVSWGIPNVKVVRRGFPVSPSPIPWKV